MFAGAGVPDSPLRRARWAVVGVGEPASPPPVLGPKTASSELNTTEQRWRLVVSVAKPEPLQRGGSGSNSSSNYRKYIKNRSAIEFKSV